MKKLIFILLWFNFLSTKANTIKTSTSDITENIRQTTPKKKKKSVVKKKSISKSSSAISPVVTRNPKETAQILNYVLGGDKNQKNKALVNVNNLSNCDITVSFNGNASYQLEVKANTIGRILVEKGKYDISSKICTALYKTEMEVTDITTLKMLLK